MPTVTVAIDIAAPPSVVREKFLDFPSLPTYHRGHFISISHAPKSPNSTVERGINLQPGDTMHNVLEGMTIMPKVLENSPEAFIWGGKIPVILTGSHSFLFKENVDGGTTFVQIEKWNGLFGFVLGENWVARRIGLTESTKRGFKLYNEDLKRWVETDLPKV